jgi:hypothetical protein
MTKSEPSRNLNQKKIIEYEKKLKKKYINKNAQPGGEVTSSPACAIGAFIGLHGQKCITELDFGLG